MASFIQVLYINTTLEDQLEVALYNLEGQKTFSLIRDVNRDESEKLLPAIDQALRYKVSSKKRTGEFLAATRPQGIIVVKGPHGRFSAIRSGVVCANALGFAWDVPVIGIESRQGKIKAIAQIIQLKNFRESVIPLYSKEPNINI